MHRALSVQSPSERGGAGMSAPACCCEAAHPQATPESLRASALAFSSLSRCLSLSLSRTYCRAKQGAGQEKERGRSLSLSAARASTRTSGLLNTAAGKEKGGWQKWSAHRRQPRLDSEKRVAWWQMRECAGGLSVGRQEAARITAMREPSRAVGFQHLAAEKEEAKAVVMQFLKSLGLSTALSSRVTKKGGQFVNHLLSILHTRYHLRYLVGRELTTAEIQETLLSYLEALAAEHGDGIVDFVVHFSDSPQPRSDYYGVGLSSPSFAKPLPMRDGTGMSELMLNGNYRPSVSYALSLGLSLEQVEVLARKSPSFIACNPEKRVQPVVKYFLGLGVTKLGILKILLKRPQIFVCRLEECLKPSMLYLESLGVERGQWSRILVQFPALLTYGKAKIQEAVAFLHEAGLSSADVGFVISRFPHVVSFNVEENLTPTLEFLKCVGVQDVASFLRRSPQVLGLSVEGNMKPTIRFLIELGYSQMEVITIINKFPQILGLAINSNIKPKWDYYAETGWPKAYLVAFPQYFGYSLKSRIKPRFEEVLRHEICWSPSRILCSSDKEFQRLLKNHVEESAIHRPSTM